MAAPMNRGRRILAVAVVAALSVAGVLFVVSQRGAAGGLVPFTDYSQLYAYLDRLYAGAGQYGVSNGSITAAPTAPGAGGAPGASYSTTNVQVAGIDELDTVKTDGSYLYLAAGSQVAIVDARTPSALAVIARVPAAAGSDVNLSLTRVTGLFLAQGRLVVVAAEYGYTPGIYGAPTPAGGPGPIAPSPSVYGMAGRTFLSVYGLADPSHPALQDAAEVTGWPLTARLIDPYVYVVIGEPILRINETWELPATCGDSGCAPLPATSIYYDPTALEVGSFTNLLALDATSGASTTISVITGYTSTVYMSPQALYLTYAKWSGTATAIPVQGAPVPSGVTTTWTTIHKVAVSGTTMVPVAHADVPGMLLNQFSLDENVGYLRVATSQWQWTDNGTWQTNNLFVLDGNLDRVGSLTGIAPGEQIFAARFLGDRAYLVTYQKVDPLFVIDVSDPAAPRILGELEMPGFSDYLHPVDAGHLLGVGKDAVNATEGNFSWYQGLKIGLFNVTDAAHPAQMGQVLIGDRGTTSDVIWDHKAFLPIPDADLAVLPVDLALINESAYGGTPPSWAYGDFVWQGVYVLHVSPQDGVSVVGRVTQENGTADPSAGVYLDANRAIHRSLYIGDDLFTISPARVQVNALADLSLVDAVDYA